MFDLRTVDKNRRKMLGLFSVFGEEMDATFIKSKMGSDWDDKFIYYFYNEVIYMIYFILLCFFFFFIFFTLNICQIKVLHFSNQ